MELFCKRVAEQAFESAHQIQNTLTSPNIDCGNGRYSLAASVVTNTVYYGTAFILYLCGTWTPTLTGIALLFGIGNAFDSIVSGGAFAFL